jgi:hypothetical protein
LCGDQLFNPHSAHFHGEMIRIAQNWKKSHTRLIQFQAWQASTTAIYAFNALKSERYAQLFAANNEKTQNPFLNDNYWDMLWTVDVKNLHSWFTFLEEFGTKIHIWAGDLALLSGGQRVVASYGAKTNVRRPPVASRQ